MSDAFRLTFERPSDRLLTDRAQFFSGSFRCPTTGFRLRARCRRVEVPLAEFRHPDRLVHEEIRGFWGILFLQDCLQCLDDGWLFVDFSWEERKLATIALRVSPQAAETARRCPLGRKKYRVRNSGRSPWSGPKPETLIFPGLGGVGGSSLNFLMRLKMLEEGWEVPIRGEANDAGLWAALGRRESSRARWIDGHDCHAAGRFVSGRWARVTLLREPEARLVSLFNWGCVATPAGFPHATFEDFVFSEDVAGFTQAHQLLRLAGRTPPPDADGEEVFCEAEAELRRAYALVGVTERFEETLFLMADLAGYREVGLWWRALSAPPFARLDALSPAARRRLREVVAVDRRLYEAASREFARIFNEADFGDPLVECKRDAANQPQLTEAEKLFECLRWRQLLAEDELQSLRSRFAAEHRK